MSTYQTLTIPEFNDDGSESIRYGVVKDGVLIAMTLSTGSTYADEIVSALTAADTA